MALNLTLLLEKEKGISHLNICGGSLLTIWCIKWIVTLHNYSLQPIFQDVQWSTLFFSHISFNHVYMNQNQEANKLSKIGLVFDRGMWKIFEKTSKGTSEYIHNSQWHLGYMKYTVNFFKAFSEHMSDFTLYKDLWTNWQYPDFFILSITCISTYHR